MKFVGTYEGHLAIKVTHNVTERSLDFKDVKERWEHGFNSALEALIKDNLTEEAADVEVVLIQEYADMKSEGDDYAGEKL